MSAEPVKSWASESRARDDHQSVEAQHIIDICEKLFLNKTSPADAAQSINDELYALMKANPADLRITSVWGIVCHAVREFWKDLPGFALTFDADLEPDEDLTDSEWLAQKTHFHNATSFAATALAASPHFSGFIFFFPVCMRDAFGGVDDEPAPPVRAAMYIPAVLAWLVNAGDNIYQLSKEGTQKGLDTDAWLSWKNSLDQVAADSSIGDDMRRLASEAKHTMSGIETRFGDSCTTQGTEET
ncbi:hypothetical protein GGS24DRAFT_473294 [Hypoxylon argillaceum]|nr:hypothetical protein GGS24DRAFT_473294 [Hypoxylon argillaceum]